MLVCEIWPKFVERIPHHFPNDSFMGLKNIFNTFALILNHAPEELERVKAYDNKSAEEIVAELKLRFRSLSGKCRRRLDCGEMSGDIEAVEFLLTALDRRINLRGVELSGGRRPESHKNNVPSVDTVPDFIKRVDRIIAENIHRKDFGVDMIVEKLPVGRTSLYSRFKELSGQSIGTYIVDYRVKRSKELLADGKITINEISKSLGFSSQRYFSTFFKDKTGKTPSEYRTEVIPAP